MTPRAIRILVVLVALLSSAAVFGAPPPGNVASSGPQPIRNRVLDLLNQATVLNTAGVAVWESAPFDTSQFEWAGLHVSATSPDGNVRCQTAWTYGADDEAVLGPPSTSILSERNQFPGSVPAVSSNVTSIGVSVQGLEARIVCRVELGGDPSGDPPQATGTITDVKVLLRRF